MGGEYQCFPRFFLFGTHGNGFGKRGLIRSAGRAKGSGDRTSALGGDYRFELRVINGGSVGRLEHGAPTYV